MNTDRSHRESTHHGAASADTTPVAETVPVDKQQLPWRVRRAVRDLERRAPRRGKAARVRWWHRLRGLAGLAVSAVVIGVLMAALVLSALALAVYLLNQFAK